MGLVKKFLLQYAPPWIQDIAITIYNTWQYRRRHGGSYTRYRQYFSRYENAEKERVVAEHRRKLRKFLNHAVKNSSWYASVKWADLEDFPILEKGTLLSDLDKIATVHSRDAVVSLTGGTTGASMKVLYTQEDIQERNALLDHFRASYGYSLGKKTAWFSGKDLARPSDLVSGRCYRDDLINNIRFFATFHIGDQYFSSYWKAFTEFSPEYIVGFPSSVYDLCALAEKHGLQVRNRVKVFFPTAETVLPRHREVIGRVLGCALIDQYASSEGAPFILQCRRGRLHIHPLSGVFEVVDENMNPAREGEVLVTSFSTRGTPLIRYRIGDRITLAPDDYLCSCGSCFPVVEYIDGRTSDFILSPDNGRVNLGNISNSTKDAPGIISFQVVQEDLYSVDVSIVKGSLFTKLDEENFLKALQARLGTSMSISIAYVNENPKEKSGKFRIVKNRLSQRQLGQGVA